MACFLTLLILLVHMQDWYVLVHSWKLQVYIIDVQKVENGQVLDIVVSGLFIYNEQIITNGSESKLFSNMNFFIISIRWLIYFVH